MEAAMSTSAPELFRLPPRAGEREKREWREQMLLWLHGEICAPIRQKTREVERRTAEEDLKSVERWHILRARAGYPEGLRRLYPSPKLPAWSLRKWLSKLPTMVFLQKTMEISTQSMDQFRKVLFREVDTVRIHARYTAFSP
jgi:hypothetical protein